LSGARSWGTGARYLKSILWNYFHQNLRATSSLVFFYRIWL
jgi:hypothetical protein